MNLLMQASYMFPPWGDSAFCMTIYWAVPITTSEQDLLSVNQETFTVWVCSGRFDGMAFAEFSIDRSHGSRVR